MAIQQILYSNKNEKPSFLLPGQLAYSYTSDILYIGAGTPETGSDIVLELARGSGYLINYIDPTLTTKTPNSQVIYTEIKEKLDTVERFANFNKLNIKTNFSTIIASDVKSITLTNDFTFSKLNNNEVSIGLMPIFKNFTINNSTTISPLNNSLNIINDINISLTKVNNDLSITVNTSNNLNNDYVIPTSKAVKDYVYQIASNIISNSTIQRFIFDQPSLQYLVNHNRNTTLFNVEIKDLYYHPVLADIEVLDNNNFIVNFTCPEPCIVDVRF
jgi:hypothetical protein